MRENRGKYPCTFNNEPPYEVIATDCLSSDEIRTLKACEDALDRLYNSGRFLFTLDYLTNQVGIEPFDLFFDFGNSVNGNKMKLCDYSQKLYNFFCDRCDKEILREKILCDLLSSTTAAQIPHFLKIQDSLYKKVKKYFTDNIGKEVKIAILYSSNSVFVVDQSKEKNLQNRYDGKYYNINDLKL